ncbi:MAG: sulfatase [Aureliella sp.]
MARQLVDALNQMNSRFHRWQSPLIAILVLAVGFPVAAIAEQQKRPNIVWIIPDDMSANFSCYGETAIETPNVDRLAKRGVKFTAAHVTAPVCSTCRSAFITGMYQTTIGAHHHRSGRGEKKITLPEHIQLVPKLFQDAGYYTTISGWPGNGRLGKTDYNFQWDQGVYDGSDWSGRAPGQPFFAQLQTKGGKLRGKDQAGWDAIAKRAESKIGSSTPTSSVVLPPYYPDHPDLVRDWAAYLDSVRLTDAMVGEVVQRLTDEGLIENTLIVFMTDHGISHARGKQFLYDEGTHVPLVIAGPQLGGNPIVAGSVRTDVVEHIDIAALSLAAAGIAIPDSMQARDILAFDYQMREAAFSARDRCDETVDHIRSVRTTRYRYIRNFLPERPYLQPCAYKDAKAILQAIRSWEAAGKLDPVQQLVVRKTRPPEELYDTRTDPFQVHNLAANPAYQDQLLAMREMLDKWMEKTGDQGRTPESQEMYDSDMKVYTDGMKRKNRPEQLQVILDNIAQMKAWAAQGK